MGPKFFPTVQAQKEAAARLKLARQRAAYRSASAAAREFGDGAVSTYGSHENGSRGMSPEDATNYAEKFGVSFLWLYYGQGEMTDLSSAPGPTPTKAGFAADLPVYDAAQGGPGNLLISTDPSEYVETPDWLRGIRNAYAIRVVGDSMEPEFREGDIAYVNPARMPVVGEPHIFYNDDPKTGEAKAMIKYLVGQTETKWKLQQFNPPQTFNANKADWPVAHLVPGGYSRR